MILSQPLSPLPGEIRRAGREADQMLTPITRSRSSTGISSGPRGSVIPAGRFGYGGANASARSGHRRDGSLYAQTWILLTSTTAPTPVALRETGAPLGGAPPPVRS